LNQRRLSRRGRASELESSPRWKDEAELLLKSNIELRLEPKKTLEKRYSIQVQKPVELENGT